MNIHIQCALVKSQKKHIKVLPYVDLEIDEFDVENESSCNSQQGSAFSITSESNDLYELFNNNQTIESSVKSPYQ